MLKRLRHMLIKEFIQVFRDKRTRVLLFVPPLIQMLVFGYAATLEIKHLPVAIIDYDNSPISRDLVSRLQASRYFHIREHLSDHRQIKEVIDKGEVKIAIQINSEFAQNIRKGQSTSIQVIVDSSNSNSALLGLGYINEVIIDFAKDYQQETLRRSAPFLFAKMPKIVVEKRPWYNPDMSSQWFFVPGVIGNLMLIMVITLTAFAIVREREIGTLEQIMVTPIRRVEFILGKTLPFFLIGLGNALLIATVGTLWFKVPLQGSAVVLALGSTLFLLCVLGIALFISTISLTQQQAMVTSFFFSMPAIVFSGFGSPISSMPEFLQLLTYLNPLRYFQTLIRSVYLKGVGLDVLWQEMLAMAVIATIMLTISVMRFKKSLE